MNNPWRFFIVAEALLFILALWQIVHNPGLAVLLTIGVLLVAYVSRKASKTHFNNFQFVLGVVFIVIGAMNSTAVWFMLIFGVLFIGLKGFEISGVDIAERAPWRKKQMIMVETAAKEPKNGKRFKRRWFANERIGNNIYEWDDINIAVISGDTIIDLGNTLLPKDDNIVIVRKGIGRTRILVPLGVAIRLEHATLVGNVLFEEEQFSLKNEQIKIYSSDYDENPRRLKIITNTLIGDVEVIRI